ncbi:MAG: DMT family transporter [Gemmatimonadales bacterium]
MMGRRRDAPIAFISLALAGVIWGASFVLGKVALLELSVAHLMLYRFTFASIGFLPLLWFHRPALDRGDWALVVVAAAIGVPVQFLMQFEGLARTTASHAALMIGTAPVLVAVAAFLLFHERLRPSAWVALGASTLGVALIVMRTADTATTPGAQPTIAGDMLVLMSMFAAVVWILISKRLMTRHSPVVVSGLITVTGTLMLAVWVMARDGLPPTTLRTGTWLATLALGLIATTCTTLLWNWGLAHTDAGKAGAFINLEPVIGAILGVWLLHESLGPHAVIGGALIVAGALFVGLQKHDAIGRGE